MLQQKPEFVMSDYVWLWCFSTFYELLSTSTFTWPHCSSIFAYWDAAGHWLVALVFSPAGLRFPSVAAVWHAAGDEGSVRGNPAQEMEHHLQVLINKRWLIFAVCVNEAQRDWESDMSVLFLLFISWRCVWVRAALTFPFLVLRSLGRTKLVWPLHTHLHTSVGLWENVLVLVLKFYDQPERGSVLKQTSGTFSALQNG